MIRTSWAPAILIALSSVVLPAGPAAAQSPHTHEHSFSDAENGRRCSTIRSATPRKSRTK